MCNILLGKDISVTEVSLIYICFQTVKVPTTKATTALTSLSTKRLLGTDSHSQRAVHGGRRSPCSENGLLHFPECCLSDCFSRLCVRMWVVEWVMSGPWADSLFSAAVNHTPSLTEEQCSGLHCTLHLLQPTLQAALCLFSLCLHSFIHSLVTLLPSFLPHKWCFTSRPLVYCICNYCVING